jgi:predicted RNase H-like HicB family nuclease
MNEIIFDVREDEVDGGYTASALGYGIHTQGNSLEELRAMVKDAVRCYFDETMEAPKVIRLHFVREEILVA